jgi:DNA-binding PadR family transcriptional regulator
MPAMERPQTSTTELVILGLIAFGERSGYDLSQQVEQSVGFLWGPSRSQIYKVLPRLVQLGFARAREVQQRDRPDKALYRITRAGRRALRSWLEEVDEEPAGGPNVFVLKLFFCDLVPARAARAQLAGYRMYLSRHLRRFESMLKGLDEDEHVFPQLVLRRAIARIRTSLSWTDEVDGVIGDVRSHATPTAKADVPSPREPVP